MWQFRIVKTSAKCYEAFGYLDGDCQGSYWHSRDEKKLRHVLSLKWPDVDVM